MVTTTCPPGSTLAVSNDRLALAPCCAATGSKLNIVPTTATKATANAVNVVLYNASLPQLVAWEGSVYFCGRCIRPRSIRTLQFLPFLEPPLELVTE